MPSTCLLLNLKVKKQRIKKTVSMLSENKNIDTKIVIIRVDKTLRNENPSQMKLLKLIAIYVTYFFCEILYTVYQFSLIVSGNSSRL